MRTAEIKRETKETKIAVRIDLDGSGKHEIDTGIGFLDHMLTQIAVHGLFDLTVKAKGDLEIDPHHTMEDVAICLGAAFLKAVGDKKGIVRAAHAYQPMDETLAFVAVDLSGRPYCVFNADFRGYQLGAISTSLFEHFFESFATHAMINLHARVEYGKDDHHKAEALFKALARALFQATRINPRRGEVPSSKGEL